MRRRILLSICCLHPLALEAGEGLAPGEFFEARIRPLLSENCFACHGELAKGKLRLDSRAGVLEGGKSGPAILPGKPDESLVIQAVRRTHERLRMPPEGRLRASEVADLADWIRMGAPWPAPAGAIRAADAGEKAFLITAADRSFWSFRPLASPDLPPIKDESWPRTDIDRFILAALEDEGLAPVEPAGRVDLIRRASLDLTGLPPAPEEVDAFLSDSSGDAFAKVVDRLLASPHHGEQWGRHWLDVARYAEDDVRGLSQESYPHAFRYRDWVIQALNDDMPYDLFVKAQIAADLLERDDRDRLLPGLGFLGLGPWYYDIAEPPQARADERNDRIDAITRGFLGLTVACARCHDHKYDPIATEDYYALAGVFASSHYREYPLAPPDVVERVEEHRKKMRSREAALKGFVEAQSKELSELLARKTSLYVTAAWEALRGPKTPAADIAAREKLDLETLERWIRFLRESSPVPSGGEQGGESQPSWLRPWHSLSPGTIEDARKAGEAIQATLLGVHAEKKVLDERNREALAKAKSHEPMKDIKLPNGFSTYDEFCPGCNVAVEALEKRRFGLWSRFFGDDGLLRWSKKDLSRFLGAEWKDRLASLEADLEAGKKESPPPYEYLHGVGEAPHPGDGRLNVRGSPYSLGKEVRRGFLTVLSDGERAPFRKGSGRLELAEAIASHPLAARVLANRIWHHHFGSGLVRTPSNFGRLGERPTHPDLLEHLAARLRAGGSMKALHREILLSAVYQLGTRLDERNHARDPENRLLWRANRRRLPAESLRDSILFVSGRLDPTLGGPSFELADDSRRRTVYARVSRFRLSSLLAVFDFPDPGSSSERRTTTNVPLQRLVFLNSGLLWESAGSLAERLAREGGDEPASRIRRAYKVLFGRDPDPAELRLGLEFIAGGEAGKVWREYSQVLLSSNELLFME